MIFVCIDVEMLYFTMFGWGRTLGVVWHAPNPLPKYMMVQKNKESNGAHGVVHNALTLFLFWGCTMDWIVSHCIWADHYSYSDVVRASNYCLVYPLLVGHFCIVIYDGATPCDEQQASQLVLYLQCEGPSPCIRDNFLRSLCYWKCWASIT